MKSGWPRSNTAVMRGSRRLRDLCGRLQVCAVRDGLRSGPHATTDTEADGSGVDEANGDLYRSGRESGRVQRGRCGRGDMNGQDLVAAAVQQRLVRGGELTRARMAGGDDGPRTAGDHRVELVRVEVDPFRDSRARRASPWRAPLRSGIARQGHSAGESSSPCRSRSWDEIHQPGRQARRSARRVTQP